MSRAGGYRAKPSGRKPSWGPRANVSRNDLWDDRFDESRRNTHEGGISHTTPVGSYPTTDRRRNGATGPARAVSSNRIPTLSIMVSNNGPLGALARDHDRFEDSARLCGGAGDLRGHRRHAVHAMDRVALKLPRFGRQFMVRRRPVLW